MFITNFKQTFFRDYMGLNPTHSLASDKNWSEIEGELKGF